MAAPIAQNIVAHAWNKDHSQIAISPNNDEVLIYETKGSEDPSKWVKIHTLKEHDGFVSGIDWCGATNTIVTCGHDRNAYVWEYKQGQWHHGLVILRISRAATGITWSPDGKKFAVTSGAKCVPICTFETEHNFWLSKHIKKGFKSTVISLAWCVNNKFIVTGSTDKKCRIHSAYTPHIDSSEDDGFGDLWPQQHEFGACLATFDQANAWVNSVAWSPNGTSIAFAGHGGTLHYVELAGMDVKTLCTKFLPYSTIKFLSDDAIVGGGWDMNPGIYIVSNGALEFVALADVKKKTEKAPAKKKSQNRRAAFDMFQGMATRGTAKKSTKAFSTRHQNCITSISVDADCATKFCTTGLDGRVLFWDLSKVEDPNMQSAVKLLT